MYTALTAVIHLAVTCVRYVAQVARLAGCVVVQYVVKCHVTGTQAFPVSAALVLAARFFVAPERSAHFAD
jgi:hypothetical protein